MDTTSTCSFLVFISVLLNFSCSLLLPESKLSQGLRVFHPAFPNFVTQEISVDDAHALSKIKQMVNPFGDSLPDLSGLPWCVFPDLGLADKQNIWSKSQIYEAYERNRHNGFIVW